MYLRDVMVLPANYENETIGRLRQSSDHVLDILRYYLPKKYDLGSLRRIVIELGSTEALAQDAYRDGGLGVGYYSASTFQLERYFGLPGDEQEQELAQCVGKCFVDIARIFGTDAEPLQLAVQQLKRSNFRLEVELKCSKAHPSRRLRVKIIRRFAPGGVFVRGEVWSRGGDLLLVSELMSAEWIVTVDHSFHSSRWNGNTLEVLDGSREVTAKIHCDAYLVP